jgi:hypothetical protein
VTVVMREVFRHRWMYSVLPSWLHSHRSWTGIPSSAPIAMHEPADHCRHPAMPGSAFSDVSASKHTPLSIPPGGDPGLNSEL